MHLNNAHEIPHYLIRLADILDKSPLFDGSGCIFKKCKVMSLPKNDARIWEIFHENSRKIRNTHAWFLGSFGNGMLLFDPNRNPVRDGVVLSLDVEDKKCSLAALQSSYAEVLNRVRDGWGVEPKKNPFPYFEADPKEFDLFTKDRSLIEEDSLIRFVISRLSLEDDVNCDADNGKIYLWIRTSALENVINKMGFRLSPSARL